jgi:hypothetical protein
MKNRVLTALELRALAAAEDYGAIVLMGDAAPRTLKAGGFNLCVPMSVLLSLIGDHLLTFGTRRRLVPTDEGRAARRAGSCDAFAQWAVAERRAEVLHAT